MKKKLFNILLCFYFAAGSTHGQQTVGLFTQNVGSLDGYVLFAPTGSSTTFLIDKCGYLVHSWSSAYQTGQSVYLLENGILLRPGRTSNTVFTGGGGGGIIEKYDWNSNVLWSYTISDSNQCQHHDVRHLPNGNILVIVWEKKTYTEAIAAGRNPALLGASVFSEKIVELQPVGTDSANLVWEWHIWDHLVQDFDAAKNNYGNISLHPELLNLNYVVGMPTATDWLHVNAIDYNATLDQIIISSRTLSEIWIIDHSTTTAEAASHSGGVHGKGGDLLYRWGNPEAYNRGTAADKKLFGQHNPRWIENGFPDAGNIMVFNNGFNRPQGNYSSVEIISPPIDISGNYLLNAGQPYQPDSSYWKYMAPVPTDFFSSIISGAQRLSNGNTIICEGVKGNFFEIDAAENIVWRYVSPVDLTGIISQGTTPGNNSVFRCTLYEPSFPGLSGQVLTPGNPIELNPLAYNCTMLTGIDETGSANSAVKILNPFGDKIILSASGDLNASSIVLYNAMGQLMETIKNISILKNQSVEITVDKNLSEGIYFLKLTNTKIIFTKKLMHHL